MISKLRARTAGARPFIIGALAGAGLTVVVGFASGTIVMAGTVAQEVEKARISTMARVCAQQAGMHWTSEGNEHEALAGWSNEKRQDLAQRFAPGLEDAATAEVVRQCSNMLKPA